MQTIIATIGNWICRTFHGCPMWPVRGRYICRRCLRAWPVDWERAPCAAVNQELEVRST